MRSEVRKNRDTCLRGLSGFCSLVSVFSHARFLCWHDMEAVSVGSSLLSLGCGRMALSFDIPKRVIELKSCKQLRKIPYLKNTSPLHYSKTFKPVIQDPFIPGGIGVGIEHLTHMLSKRTDEKVQTHISSTPLSFSSSIRCPMSAITLGDKSSSGTSGVRSAHIPARR